MANINQSPNYTYKGGTSGFDLSHRFAFSSSVGQLLPVYADELYPGDHVKLSADMFTRTEPLNKAAFTRITEHIDYFFVPFTQLYSLFDSFITSVQDIHSSWYLSGQPSDEIPAIKSVDFGAAMELLYDSETRYLDPDDSSTAYIYYNMRDEFDEPSLYGAQTLLDFLGYGNNVAANSASSYYANMPNLNPFRLAAYQKIWFDYYRLSDWNTNDPDCYNFDQYFSSGSIGSGSIIKMLKMRYRPWKKDFYTNILPSPLVGRGSVNIMPNIQSDLNQWLYSSSQTPKDQNSLSGNGKPTTVGFNYSDTTVGIRTAFAYEKLLEITRRAGKHYDLQTLAHFGVKPPRRVDGDVFYLGSQSTPIQINDVVSTAETAQASLGEIGGKGYASMNGNGIDFTANTHGIIMAIYSAVPESDYSHDGIDRQNTYVKKYDYFTPELDDIGMQPLFVFDANFNPSMPATQRNTIMGWQYRYSESKQKYDQAHGKFVTLSTGWITYRNAWLNDITIDQRLYISPNYLNPIMEVNYNMPGKTRCATDPLIHDLYWKSFKTSKMSTYGLPNL